MRPTSWRLLLVTAAVGFATGFLGARFWDLWTGSPPTVPWAAPLMLLVLAAGFAVGAWTLRPRIERREGHRPLDPFTAARTAVLALAGTAAGAAVCGVYLGYAAFLLLDLTNDYRRRMVLIALVAAAAGQHWRWRRSGWSGSAGSSPTTTKGARRRHPPERRPAQLNSRCWSPIRRTLSSCHEAATHSLSPPDPTPRLLVAAIVVAALVVAAVWVVDETWVVRVGVTGIVVVALVAIWSSSRAGSRAADQFWREAVERRREAAETHRELAELKSLHLELLLEIRTMREEAVQQSQEAARIASEDADQRALMRQMLQPRPTTLDPMYPSLHLPLVRAAFSTELPATPISTPRPAPPGLQRESTSGGEPQPTRQLLDLTASEIDRLRPAN